MDNYNGDVKTLIDSFHSFLKETANTKNDEIRDIDSKLNFYNEIKKFKDTKDILYLTNLEQDLFDDNTRKLIELAAFLTKENLKSIPQFIDALDKLTNIPIINTSDSKVNEFNNRREVLQNEIDEINNIISNKDYNIDKFTLFLSQSGLDENTQILILCDAVYNSCPEKIEEHIEKLEKEEIMEEPFDINGLMNDAKQFYEKYYYVIATDSDEIKSERKSNYYIIDLLINEDEFNPNKSNFEILAILLYELKNQLSKLESNQNKSGKSIDELKELKELSTKVSKYVSYGNCLVEEMKRLKLPKGEEKAPKNNIIYLTDDEDEVLFNRQKGSFTEDEIKLAASVIKKLENSSPEDDTRLVRGLIGNNNKVFAIKSSDVVCTYMRLSNNIILVITIGKSNDVYDDTKQVEKKYREKIGYLEGASYFKPQMLLESELKIIDEMKEFLTSSSMTK